MSVRNAGEVKDISCVSTVNSLPSCLLTLRKCVAFTLAETLITLAIIGVVAAMTMPTLIAKHQKQVTVNKLKKAYSVLGQMVTKSFADNGPADLSGAVTAEKTENFFKTYWLQYFNGAKVVLTKSNEYLYGIAQPFKKIDGTSQGVSVYTDYKKFPRLLFIANDGIIYFIYMTSYSHDEDGTVLDSIYAPSMQLYVDLNGVNGPNIMGRDVFLYIIDYNTLKVRPYNINSSESIIDNDCKSSGLSCAAKIMKDGWQIAPDYPW